MRILAFDPGYARLGWGAINTSSNFSNISSNLSIIGYGTLESSLKDSPSLRMYSLYKQLAELIKKIKPSHLGMERLYFSKNKKTVAGVYQAQGLILALAGKNNCPFVEIEPVKIKKSLTGYGSASKNAVMQMTARLLNQDNIVGYDDASDALACAIASYFHFSSLEKQGDLQILR